MAETSLFTERFNCPTCEGAIDRADIIIRARPGATRYDARRQAVTVHCEHCKTITRIERRESSVGWQLDAIKPINDHADRRSVLDQLDRQRKQMQMEVA